MRRPRRKEAQQSAHGMRISLAGQRQQRLHRPPRQCIGITSLAYRCSAGPLRWPVSGLTDVLSSPSQVCVVNACPVAIDESWMHQWSHHHGHPSVLPLRGQRRLRGSVHGSLEIHDLASFLLPVELQCVNRIASTNARILRRGQTRRPGAGVNARPARARMVALRKRQKPPDGGRSPPGHLKSCGLSSTLNFRDGLRMAVMLRGPLAATRLS